MSRAPVLRERNALLNALLNAGPCWGSFLAAGSIALSHHIAHGGVFEGSLAAAVCAELGAAR